MANNLYDVLAQMCSVIMAVDRTILINHSENLKDYRYGQSAK